VQQAVRRRGSKILKTIQMDEQMGRRALGWEAVLLGEGPARVVVAVSVDVTES